MIFSGLMSSIRAMLSEGLLPDNEQERRLTMQELPAYNTSGAGSARPAHSPGANASQLRLIHQQSFNDLMERFRQDWAKKGGNAGDQQFWEKFRDHVLQDQQSPKLKLECLQFLRDRPMDHQQQRFVNNSFGSAEAMLSLQIMQEESAGAPDLKSPETEAEKMRRAVVHSPDLTSMRAAMAKLSATGEWVTRDDAARFFRRWGMSNENKIIGLQLIAEHLAPENKARDERLVASFISRCILAVEKQKLLDPNLTEVKLSELSARAQENVAQLRDSPQEFKDYCETLSSAMRSERSNREIRASFLKTAYQAETTYLSSRGETTHLNSDTFSVQRHEAWRPLVGEIGHQFLYADGGQASEIGGGKSARYVKAWAEAFKGQQESA